MRPSALGDDLAIAFSEAEAAGVVAAYVFGSCVEGREHRDSDVDVAVLLDREQFRDEGDRFDTRLRLIGRLGARVHRDIDLVVLNDAPPELARAIVTRGRRIFCRDEDADRAFGRLALSRAADLAPFLRRMRRIKLEVIRRDLPR